MGYKKKKKNGSRAAALFDGLLASVFILMPVLILLTFLGSRIRGSDSFPKAVLEHRDMIMKYAKEEGISGYMDELLTIVEIESGGTLEDVMQSSESLGLPVNSLEREESVAQGCAYFAKILAEAKQRGLGMDAVFQAYNYGIGYLKYVSDHGGKHSFEIAQQFAEEMSGGKKETYRHPVAVVRNGGWRYSYGNMFYSELAMAKLKMRRQGLLLGKEGTVYRVLSGIWAAAGVLILLKVLYARYRRSGSRRRKRG